MAVAPVFHPGTAFAAAPAVTPQPARLSRFGSWLIAGYLLALGIQFDLIAAGRFAPSDVFLGAYLLLYWHKLRFRPEVWTIFHWGMLAIFLIGTLLTVSKWGTITTYILVNKDIGLLLLFGGYAVFTHLSSDWETIRRIVRIYINGVAIQCVLAVGAYLIYKLTGTAVSWLNFSNDRVSGMLIDPNAFGGYVGTALVIHGCTLFSRNPIIPGIRGMLYSVIMAMALMLTLSRSAWMGFGLALLITIPFRPRMAFAYTGMMLATVLAIVMVLGDRVNDVVALADRKNTAQQRVDQIIQAIPMFSESPIIGTGLAVFRETNGWLIHNTTVWILTEFGLVGITVYLGFLGCFFIRGFAAYRTLNLSYKPLILGLLAAHGCMLGVSAGIEALYQRHWWLMFALIASVYALSRNREPAQDYAQRRIGQQYPAWQGY